MQDNDKKKQNEAPQIPVIKRDAKFSIEIGYSEAAAIVNSLFIQIKAWTPKQVEDFKRIIEEKGSVTEMEHVVYTILDQLYRRILIKAKEENMLEYTEFDMGNPIPETNPEG